ncbi:hypothetical protein Plhal304r1_c051g0134751 [Plasmopara halstedii]
MVQHEKKSVVTRRLRGSASELWALNKMHLHINSPPNYSSQAPLPVAALSTLIVAAAYKCLCLPNLS